MSKREGLSTRVTTDPAYEPVLKTSELFAVADEAKLNASALVEARFDRKYIVSRENVVGTLGNLRDLYCVALAGSRRLARYDTVYFDTSELDFYHDHRRRKLPRTKVRVRSHLDRNLAFLEVKTKNARGETNKVRSARTSMELVLSDADREILSLRAADLPRELSLSARTVFRRLTLVGTNERCTMDFDLILARGERSFFSENAVIVEIKCASREQKSPLLEALTDACEREGRRLAPASVSKYCAAIALLGDEPRDPNWSDSFRRL